MKKLCRKGTVHPSDHLSLLPAAILGRTAALSPQDKEVLAYLISSSNKNISNPQKSTRTEHPSSFKCDCFRCYKSYWIRWDSSPNRQLIHEIIDAFEDYDAYNKKKKKKKKKKDDRKRRHNTVSLGGLESSRRSDDDDRGEEVTGGSFSLRRFVSFVGQRIWGVLF